MDDKNYYSVTFPNGQVVVYHRACGFNYNADTGWCGCCPDHGDTDCECIHFLAGTGHKCDWCTWVQTI